MGERSDASAMSKPVMEMRDVSKRFGEIQALDDVSLALIPGEIHALLGENGAGKSTLIKVMTGVVQPDIGDIYIDGQKVHIGSAFDAQTYAVAAIYQEPMVFPDLTVAENIFIGHRDRGRIVNKGRMRQEAEQVLARLDVHLDVQAPASTLDAGPAANGRDRQGALAQHARAHHGRAHGLPLRARGRAALRHHRSVEGGGRGHPLHLPSPRGSLPAG